MPNTVTAADFNPKAGNLTVIQTILPFVDFVFFVVNSLNFTVNSAS